MNLQERLSAPGPKRILALDGGGIRGALTLGYLERIEMADRDGRASDEGTAIAIDLARLVRPQVQGIQVAVSRDRLDAAHAVAAAARG